MLLGESIVLTAQNEVTQALVRARRALDALSGAPRGRSRDLVETRVQRQLAHLLSHSADYVDATLAAEATARLASRVNDPSEVAWATYTMGFVDWYAGRIDKAVDALTKAEADLRRSGPWSGRYTLLCFAPARLDPARFVAAPRPPRKGRPGARGALGHLAR